jgi:hypothetical protein
MTFTKKELDIILDAMERGIDSINETLEDPLYTEDERAELKAQKVAFISLVIRITNELNQGETA